MGHDKIEARFPRTGVILITGENGAGKSSFVECVSWGGWSKTLRGDPPWRGEAKPPCNVGLSTYDGLSLGRTRSGGKTSLAWSTADNDATDFETTTKAQDALEDSVIGSYDLWRRSHVFSSADAAHFTLATDAERKRLIESFLGADRFDPALEKCRLELKAASSALDAVSRQQETLLIKLDAERTRITDAKRTLATLQPPAPVPIVAGQPLAELDKLITQARQEMAALEAKLREADRAGGSFDAEVRAAQTMADRLRAATCPTCAQAIPPALRARLQASVEEARAKAAEANESAATGRGEAEKARAALRTQFEAVQQKRAERAGQVRLEQQAQDEAARFEQQKASAARLIEGATRSVAKMKAELVEVEEQIDLHTNDVAELVEVEKVLGLKGVRAHIMGDSLSGIEAVANTWLARLRQGVQIQLRPYSEKKTGGTNDSISLEVTGFGRGTYKSSSAGERRRVDVALLLALGEVSSAARGQVPGTLFFDEVFDCLDEAGIEAVCDVLAELAQDRVVVVITHLRTLIEKLRGARHWHIAAGMSGALV